MPTSDAVFAGSIPALYERCMVPMLFEPYAADLARRVAGLRPAQIVETAAGTGVVTAALARAMPQARIVATDLNQAMLDVAAARISSPKVEFRQADAQSLPFADANFDMLVCQFGAMFFPDRILAYREARRVLRPGTPFLFNVWDRLDANPVSAVLTDALADAFPANPPTFYRRVPFGYHDQDRIAADLRAAGFTDIAIETVEMRSHSPSAEEAAIGLCQGSPLRSELDALGPDALARGTEAAAAALSARFGSQAIDAPMSAHVVIARAS